MFIEKGHKQGKALLMFALKNVFLTISWRYYNVTNIWDHWKQGKLC